MKTKPTNPHAIEILHHFWTPQGVDIVWTDGTKQSFPIPHTMTGFEFLCLLKSPAAVLGSKGGRATGQRKARTSEQARAAAMKRWAK
jgi:hypothetical protein